MKKAEQILSEKKKNSNFKSESEENLDLEKQLLSDHILQTLLDSSKKQKPNLQKECSSSPRTIEKKIQKNQTQWQQQYQQQQQQNLFENEVINAKVCFQDRSNDYASNKSSQQTSYFLADKNNESNNKECATSNNLATQKSFYKPLNSQDSEKNKTSFRDRQEQLRHGSVPRLLREIIPITENISPERQTIQNISHVHTNQNNTTFLKMQATTTRNSIFPTFHFPQTIPQSTPIFTSLQDSNKIINASSSSQGLNPQNQSLSSIITMPLSTLVSPSSMKNNKSKQVNQPFPKYVHSQNIQTKFHQISPKSGKYKNELMQTIFWSPKQVEQTQSQQAFLESKNIYRYDEEQTKRSREFFKNEFGVTVKWQRGKWTKDTISPLNKNEPNLNDRGKITNGNEKTEKGSNFLMQRNSVLKEQNKLNSVHFPGYNPNQISNNSCITERKERFEKSLERELTNTKMIMNGGKFTNFETGNSNTGGCAMNLDQTKQVIKIDEQTIRHLEQPLKRKSSLLPSNLRIITSNQSIASNIPQLPSQLGTLQKYLAFQGKQEQKSSSNNCTINSNSCKTNIKSNNNDNNLKDKNNTVSCNIQYTLRVRSTTNGQGDTTITVPTYSTYNNFSSNTNSNSNTISSNKSFHKLDPFEPLKLASILQNQCELVSVKKKKIETLNYSHLYTDTSDRPLPPAMMM